MDKDFLDSMFEFNKLFKTEVVKIKINMLPIGFNIEATINNKNCETSKEEKGIDKDDYKRLVNKYLEKPLRDMIEELIDIETKYLDKKF